MLNTEDADTPVEALVYNLEALTSGMVALKEAPEEAILNFTQSHVNKGEVVFIHQGEALPWPQYLLMSSCTLMVQFYLNDRAALSV